MELNSPPLSVGWSERLTSSEQKTEMMRCYFPDQVIRRSRSCLGCAFLLSLSLLDRLLWGRLATILDRGLPVACFEDAQAAYGQGHVVRK